MNIDWPACAERRRLSGAVAEAIKGVLIAKAALDAAIRDNLDSINFSQALATEREAENKAMEALHRHRNTHDC